jgi:hypothetical protein
MYREREDVMNNINFDVELEKLQNNSFYQKWRKIRRSNVKKYQGI